MSSSSAVVLLGAAVVITYAARAGLIVALAGRTMPASIQRALANVAPAVLAALTINLAVGPGGVETIELAEVVALVVAGLVAVRTRNLIWTFAAGMGALWLVAAIT